MKQAFNPYTPINEYIPDAEPHVFGDRVYIYGSHDKEGGDNFCMLDYVTYSAPVDDPFRTSVRVEPSRSAWVVTEKESSSFAITSFNS